MSSAFKSIRQGLDEAVKHGSGQEIDVRTWQPEAVDVAALRRGLSMSQQQFAARFGISVATLRHWERGDRRPRGPALVLLNLIQREPAMVLRTLA